MTESLGTGTSRFGWHAKLRKADDFSSVFRFCRTHRQCQVKGICLELWARPNNLGRARLGMIVGKRILKLAVARNRSRRIIREAFRQLQAELHGLDVVVRLINLPQPGQLGRECASLLKALTGCSKTQPAPESTA